MPEGLAEAMTPAQRRDLIRFLLDLGRSPDESADPLLGHGHAPAAFAYDRKPLRPEHWPHWEHPVNRDRVYDFYAKEAEHFRKRPTVPALLPPFPGLDGGEQGHWGNQNEATWVDGRWNQTDLGTVMSGVFRGKGLIVPKGVCVRLGERGEMAACFNPETLTLRGPLARGLRQVLADPPRLPRRPHHGRHAPAPPRRQGARAALRVPRLLPPREAHRLRLPDRRDRDAGLPLGRGRQVHEDRRPGRGPPAGRLDPRRAVAMAAGPRDPRDAGRGPAVRRRHDRAAVPQPVERPHVLRRPRLLPRRHGHDLHDAGRRLARRGARRRPDLGALAAVRLGPASGPRPGGRRRPRLRPRPRPDHAPARPGRRRRGRLLRMRQQRLRDLAGRPRLHLRPATRRGRRFLHRVRQPGAAQHRGRRPEGRGRSRPASATRTAWASRPTASSPSPAPKGSGPRRR